MKKFPVSLLLLFFLLYACTEQEQVIKTVQNDCQDFVELNFSNYDSLQSDPVIHVDVNIEGDCLQLTLQYGGGCKPHTVDLALIQPQCGTPPLPPPTFEIRHNGNNDTCEALLTNKYSFDISGIKEVGKNKTDFILSSKNSSGIITSNTYTYNY